VSRVNHSFQNYPFFIKLAKMHSGGKHQASPKVSPRGKQTVPRPNLQFQQFQNHAQPIVRKCGHVVQPPNPTRNLKSTFPTTPNLPSYSFQRVRHNLLSFRDKTSRSSRTQLPFKMCTRSVLTSTETRTLATGTTCEREPPWRQTRIKWYNNF
jgi:hypothetical protein